MTDRTTAQIGREVIDTEAAALGTLGQGLGAAFEEAVRLLHDTGGMVVVAGVGKSGHIGKKIAATLASTGTPSFFVHPTEASHGDLGMIQPGSVVLAISNSGETRELRDLLVYTGREGIPVVAITAKPESFLARHGTVTLLLPRTPEACPNGLAPTTSTTMTLALGDALAVAVMAMRGFTREDFGARHPGGSLGMQLQHVNEYLDLHRDRANPTVGADAPFGDVLKTVSDGRLGSVAVVDGDGRLVGIVTDGDIRRAVMERDDFRAATARDIMGRNPVSIAPDDRISQAIELFESRAISQVLVVDAGRPVGVVHVKDLMREGYL